MKQSAELSLWGMTTRNLLRQRLRTALTVLGVAFGVVAIVAFNTMVRGMWAQMDTAIKVGGSDLIVYEKGIVGDIFSELDETRVTQGLREDPDVEAVSAGLFELRPVEGQLFTILYGLYPGEFLMEAGESTQGRKLLGSGEILLGAITAKRISKQVGESIVIHGRSLKIVGIFETGVVFFDGGIIMYLPEMQEMFEKKGKISTCMVRLKRGAKLREVQRRLEKDVPGIVTIGSAAEYSRVDRSLEIGKGMVWAVSILALIVGSIIVMNTMWMTVLERTREIGVLRAIGWSRRKVVRMILIEAAGVGLIAGIVGCVLGVGLAELTRVLPVTSQFNRPAYDMHVFLLGLGVAVVLSLIGAIVPAYRATKISPVEALRYE